MSAGYDLCPIALRCGPSCFVGGCLDCCRLRDIRVATVAGGEQPISVHGCISLCVRVATRSRSVTVVLVGLSVCPLGFVGELHCTGAQLLFMACAHNHAPDVSPRFLVWPLCFCHSLHCRLDTHDLANFWLSACMHCISCIATPPVALEPRWTSMSMMHQKQPCTPRLSKVAMTADTGIQQQ
jgi:hypothetical protein